MSKLGFRLIVAGCCLLGSIAPALAQSPAASVDLVRSGDSLIYAATLAGRYAEATDNPALAAQAWSRAYLRRPGDRTLLQRAVQANGEIGDIGAIIQLSKRAPPDIRPPLAELALATDAFAQGRYQDVARLLNKNYFTQSQALFAKHLRAYALLAQGQIDQAVALTNPLTDDADLDSAALMSHAILLAQARKYKEALGMFEVASKEGQASPAGIRVYANLLLAQNQPSEAIALLCLRALGSSAKATQFQSALEDAQKEIRAQPLRDIQASATLGLLTLAEGLAAAGGNTSNGPELLFLVAHLSPQSEAARFALGQALAAQNKEDLAASYLAKV